MYATHVGCQLYPPLNSPGPHEPSPLTPSRTFAHFTCCLPPPFQLPTFPASIPTG